MYTLYILSYWYETGIDFYYLETRYYDPELCRFISPDSTKYLEPATLGGLNLYTYCLNNPVMYADPKGESVIAILAFIGITAIVGATIGGVSSYKSGERGLDVVLNAAIGFVAGMAIAGAIVSTIAGIGGAIGVLTQTTVTVFGGVPALQAFAIGALAYNTFPIFIAPFWGIDMELIEAS